MLRARQLDKEGGALNGQTTQLSNAESIKTFPLFYKSINELTTEVASTSSEDKFNAASKLRGLLMTHTSWTLKEIRNRAFTPHVVSWLEYMSDHNIYGGSVDDEDSNDDIGSKRVSNLSQLQDEALWIVTNMVGSPDCTKELMKSKCVDMLIPMLNPVHSHEVLEQVVWVLGNMACESVSSRDAILSSGVIDPLVICLRSGIESVIKELFNGNSDYTSETLIAATKGRDVALTNNEMLSFMRIGSWVLSTLCDGQPRPVLDSSSIDISMVIPILCELLHCNDREILAHTSWAFSYLCDSTPSHIRAVTSSGWTYEQIKDEEMGKKKGGGICKRLVELLGHSSERVVKPALRTVGNIVCAEDEVDYTQLVVQAGVLDHLKRLVLSENREIQKEACWTLSNIAAGSSEQIDSVLSIGIVPMLVELARAPGTDAEVKAEACWFILNATSCGTDEQIEFMVQHGSISVLGEMLGENSMVMMALEGLERVLQVGKKTKEKILDIPDSMSRDLQAQAQARDAHTDQDDCGKCEECRKKMADYCEEISDDGNEFSLSNEQANARRAISMSSSSSLSMSSTGSVQIAKQASKIWREHFVTCQICSNAYSKLSSSVKYCAECKCFVCMKCDCEVFHLSYQESLWEESKEEKVSKSKKKKQKAKAKKEKEKEKHEMPSTATIVNGHDDNVSNGTVELKSELQKDFDELFPEDGFEDDEGDLVGFLEESGSILALAEKIGICNT